MPTKITTAADRRAAFQSSKTIVNNGTARRAPLVRAMSAPIRPSTDESMTKVLQGKRRPLRRKKIGRSDESSPDDAFYEPNTPSSDDQELTSVEKYSSTNKTKPQKKLLPVPLPQQRSRSVLGGCDVVTLVSLLSSGGSDSEREDSNNTTSHNKNDASSSSINQQRAPMLKKQLKSGNIFEVLEMSRR